MSIQGLTSTEAQTRLALSGPNSLPADRERNIFALALEVVREPMVLLLVAAGLINFLLAEILDALLLMVTVLIVLAISIVQGRRTERALGALGELTAPLALVIRDGQEIRIPSREVVKGDLIVLLEGDRVSADAQILTCSDLMVDESLLTGESIPVAKSIGEKIFTGSLVTKGHGRALVSETGSETELGKIGKSLRDMPFERTHLQDDVNRLVRSIGILGFLTVAIVIVAFGITRGNWLEGALAGIAVAMALIPEEFPVILTLFLAIGAWRMSRVRVIARRSAAIEALGAVTVLCVDKTGTITMNQMTVTELQCDGEIHRVVGESLPPRFQRMAQTAALAAPVNAFDPMDKAFQALGEVFIDRSQWISLREYPVEVGRLAFIHLWRNDGKVIAAAKGAPETISRLCSFTEGQINDLNQQVSDAAEKGYRVLAIAHAEIPDGDFEEIDVSSIPFAYEGLALLQDPIREGVLDAVRECTSAGIRTIMITGDHPTTAIAIAKAINLPHPTNVVIGQELDLMTEAELREKIRTASVFARVTPAHKLAIIRALKSVGEIVGMTGDGVNDAPALRAAEIGIAMGGRGTDVAREAAALVITDDNFATIVEGVRRGRAIFANLQKAMTYVIAVHIPIFGMALIPVFSSSWPLVLLPALVAFHEIIIDPACSIVFEEEPADSEIMKQKPSHRNRRLLSRLEILLAVTQGFAVFLGVLFIYLWSFNRSLPDDVIRSMTFTSLVVANILLILANRSRTKTMIETLITRKNPALPWILALASTLLAVLLATPLGSLFKLGRITFLDFVICAGIALLSVSWYELFKFMNRFKTLH